MFLDMEYPKHELLIIVHIHIKRRINYILYMSIQTCMKFLDIQKNKMKKRIKLTDVMDIKNKGKECRIRDDKYHDNYSNLAT